MTRRRRAGLGLITGTILAMGLGVNASAQAPGVVVTELEGPITPVVADHLEAAVERAAAASAPLVVTIDTPGGLDVSMREIVQTFLNAPVPVIAFVEPEGARAASAGTFVTMSAHIAAMAPATSIGAATPVDIQGGDDVGDKIINDAAAFAVSVAERRGRDTEFAEAAVRDGKSITANQALESGAIDLIATDVDALLSAVDGMTVEVGGNPVVLDTDGAIPELYEMSSLRRILAKIADPNLAVLFLSIGTLAVVYEAANPGLGFAGIAGVILLVIGFFALSVLPVQTAGVALLVLAVALFIGEVFVPGVGVLAAGGTISLLLAGMFLFDGEPAVSPPVLWPTALVMGVATALAGQAALKARLQPSTTGASTLIGRAVTLVEQDHGGWSAFLDGAWWTVRPDEPDVRTGEPMEVVAVDGLELVVTRKGTQHEP